MAEPELVRRLRATEATEKKFARRKWRPGTVDCAQLALTLLRNFGWETPRLGRYRTIEEGERLLSDWGCANIAEAIDKIGLPRIAPAAMLTGDICVLPGDSPAGATAIAVGNGAVKIFHEDHDELVSFRPKLIIAAWDVMAAIRTRAPIGQAA